MKARALFGSILAAILLTLPLFAGGLKKFRDWDQSPQGYFMTKAERTQWAAIRTDEEAQKFVDAFLAARKPGFAEEVANRAAQADKYLTLGRVPGSKSVRGKVVILLGPPTEMDVAAAEREDSKRDNPIVSGAMTNTAGFDTGGRGGGTESGINTLSTVQGLRIFHFGYSGAAAKSLDRTSIEISVEADATTGKDRFTTRGGADDAEKIFEIAAARWLK